MASRDTRIHRLGRGGGRHLAAYSPPDRDQAGGARHRRVEQLLLPKIRAMPLPADVILEERDHM